MEHRIDEFRWHCGPHPCRHTGSESSPVAWRYAVCGRDYAYSLTICKSSGELALHRGFGVEDAFASAVSRECDLVAGPGCLYDNPESAQIDGAHMMASDPRVSDALMFWAKHAVQGVREQPPKFWRALERLARKAAKDAKGGNYHAMRCPRCAGSGTIVVKPKKSNKMELA